MRRFLLLISLMDVRRNSIGLLKSSLFDGNQSNFPFVSLKLPIECRSGLSRDDNSTSMIIGLGVRASEVACRNSEASSYSG
jgi:hypothetical protein